MYSVEDKIGFIRTTADAVLSDLRAAPDKSSIVTLLEACRRLDERYQQFCDEFDLDEKLEPGTTYKNNDLAIEFYIESSDWAQISSALRKLDATSAKL